MKGPPNIPLHPSHPERICWGCDEYCPADALTCGNGTERTPHPTELFGDDWYEWAHPGATERAAELKTSILEALRDVIDPELGLNIVDLGLVYDVTVDENAGVRTRMSMTTPACPLGDHLVHEAERRIAAVSGVRSVRVDLVWEPCWTPERMSEAARQVLGLTS